MSEMSDIKDELTKAEIMYDVANREISRLRAIIEENNNRFDRLLKTQPCGVPQYESQWMYMKLFLKDMKVKMKEGA